jgi:hypothetical protein
MSAVELTGVWRSFYRAGGWEVEDRREVDRRPLMASVRVGEEMGRGNGRGGERMGQRHRFGERRGRGRQAGGRR